MGRKVVVCLTLFREAERFDDPQLTQLIEQAMPGNLGLRFQRQPSYLQSCSKCGPSRQVLVAESNGEVLALCSHFLWKYWVQGQAEELWTLGDFRVKRKAAFRGITGKGWRVLRERLGDKPALMSVVDDNVLANRLFSKSRRNWPTLHPLVKLTTYILPLFPELSSPEVGVVELSEDRLLKYWNDGARPDLSPVLEAVHFGKRCPGLDSFLGLNDGAALQGCGALWFQSQNRQISIASYGGWYSKLKSLSAKFGLSLLPSLGSELSVAYASFLRANDHSSGRAVLEHLARRAQKKGASFLVWGQNAKEDFPLSPLRPRFAYHSTLYQLLWPGQTALSMNCSKGSYEVAWL